MAEFDKNLRFYENQEYLAIELDWRTPDTYFFLFFTIIWNAFLFFWYSMALSGGAPLIFALFPLIHVAVGIFLIYFTLCKFLNKTNIEIDDDLLTVQHSPIPWWRGNVEIPTDQINQLYVREDKSQTKDGTSYSYSLRAKLSDKSDKEILSITGVSNAQMQEVEEQLERFIGIIDRPVKGEFAKNRIGVELVEPRRLHRHFTESPFGPFYFSEKGNRFDLKEEEVKVLGITQFDWNDGNSDKLLQLSNEREEEKLMYFDQNKALLNLFEEEMLSLVDIGSVNFKIQDPLPTVKISGELFRLNQYKTGKKFMGDTAQGIDVEQWIYTSENLQKTIRIINNNGLIHYYKGSKLQLTDLEDTLDLSTPPEQDIEYDKPDWKEEDLV